MEHSCFLDFYEGQIWVVSMNDHAREKHYASSPQVITSITQHIKLSINVKISTLRS